MKGLFLTDLTFLDDGNPDYIHGIINLDKCNRYLKIIESFQFYQTELYEFQPALDIREKLFDAINVEKNHDEDYYYEKSLSLEPRESEISRSQMEKTANALQKTGIL
jgi:son of sevenless-like protein